MHDAFQRNVALKACRAYRTVSLHSALILSRLLDIRVREAARLYEVKRGKVSRDICADRELERPVDFCELPHPAHTPELGFESVEDLDPSTMDRLANVGPHIYTDRSRNEGKVGASLTVAGRHGIRELRISARVLLHGIPDRDVRAAQGNKES